MEWSFTRGMYDRSGVGGVDRETDFIEREDREDEIVAGQSLHL